jgi:hypothetical protein
VQGPGSPFEGIAWRDDPGLGGVNWVYLQNYYEPTDPTVVNTVKFDDVVVATKYIGCPS